MPPPQYERRSPRSEERTLFAVDLMSTRRLSFHTLTDSYYPDCVDSLRRVEQLDFDILAPGHGAMGAEAGR